MERFLVIFNAQLTLLAYMFTGILLIKLKIFSKNAGSDMMKLIQNVSLPCMIVYSMSKGITLQEILNASRIIVVSIVIMIFSCLAGWIAFRKIENRGVQAVLRYGVLASNCGSIGLSLLDSVLGAQGVICANLYATPSRIASWTAGISFFLNIPLKQKIKKILANPSLLAIILGFAFQLWEPPFPIGVWEGMKHLGNCTTPLAMMTVGIVLGTTPVKGLIDKNILVATILRLLLIPISVLVVMKLAGFEKYMVESAVLLSGSPSAIVTVVVADQYGGDTQIASKLIFVTSVLSIFTLVGLYMII